MIALNDDNNDIIYMYVCVCTYIPYLIYGIWYITIAWALYMVFQTIAAGMANATDKAYQHNREP